MNRISRVLIVAMVGVASTATAFAQQPVRSKAASPAQRTVQAAPGPRATAVTPQIAGTAARTRNPGMRWTGAGNGAPRYGHSWGAPIVIAGSMLGGAIAAPADGYYAPYDYDYVYYGSENFGYYGPDNYASAPIYQDESDYENAPGYRVASVDDITYCQQRFRSYDVATGTYLGFDGLRHACP
jgi:hypothetical protein